MPYIDQETRSDLPVPHPRSPGELNYVFTAAIVDYLMAVGLGYQTINDVVGALEGAKLEFYRRVAAPYEDTKIEQNGDVYR